MPGRRSGKCSPLSYLLKRQAGRTPLLRFFSPSAHEAATRCPVEPSTGLTRFGVGSPLRCSPGRGSCTGALLNAPAFRYPRIVLRGPASDVGWTSLSIPIRQRPWGSPFAAFLPPGRLCGFRAALNPRAVWQSSASIVFIEGPTVPCTKTSLRSSLGLRFHSPTDSWAADHGLIEHAASGSPPAGRSAPRKSLPC